jgi:hypothetical protein
MEQLLRAPADVHRHRQIPAGRQIHQQAAQMPGVRIGEPGEGEALLLLFEPGDEIVVGHADHCPVKISPGPGYAATRFRTRR